MTNDFIERIRAFDHYLSQLEPDSLDQAERQALRTLYDDLKLVLDAYRWHPPTSAQS